MDEALAALEFKVIKSLNVVAPMKRVQTRSHYAKWLTEELRLKIKRRNAMRMRAERTMDKADWKVFRDYRKVLSKQLREARQADLKADMDVKDSKERWRNIKRHSNLGVKKAEEDIELEIDGEIVTEPAKVANSLNTYFKDKVVKLRSGLDVSVEKSLDYTEEYIGQKEVGEFEFSQVSRKTVKAIVRNLTNTGATGRDGISTEVLKKYVHVLTGPLTHIINMSVHFVETQADHTFAKEWLEEGAQELETDLYQHRNVEMLGDRDQQPDLRLDGGDWPVQQNTARL